MSERIARAHRAKAALDEFFAPVLNAIRDDYLDRIQAVATQELSREARTDKLTALSTALKIVEGFNANMAAIIRDGDVARAELERMERNNNLTGPKKRLLDIGPR